MTSELSVQLVCVCQRLLNVAPPPGPLPASHGIRGWSVSRGGGELYALMRTWNEDPAKRFLWQSESRDYGRSWSPPTYSSIPTVSSAIEMVGLANGHVVLAYNDGQGRERTPLTLAVSVDGGRTWACKRNLETGEGPVSYPSIIQSRDGRLHVSYSYRRLYIKHVELNEAWVWEQEPR